MKFFLISFCFIGCIFSVSAFAEQFYVVSNPVEMDEPVVFNAVGTSFKHVAIKIGDKEFAFDITATSNKQFLELPVSAISNKAGLISYSYRLSGKRFEKTGHGSVKLKQKLSKRDIEFRKDLAALRDELLIVSESIVSLNATLSVYHFGLYVLIYEDYAKSLDAEALYHRIPGLQIRLQESIDTLEKRIATEKRIMSHYQDMVISVEETNSKDYDNYDEVLKEYQRFLVISHAEEKVLRDAVESYSILGLKAPFVFGASLPHPPLFTEKINSTRSKELKRRFRGFQKSLNIYVDLLSTFEKVSKQRSEVSFGALESGVGRLDFGYLDVL